MNERDLGNMWFILSRSNKELESWWNELDALDQEYALWIIKSYRHELKCLEDEYNDSLLLVEDLTLANDYLKRFRL